MFTTFIHLACNVLSHLVALDEGDGLLKFKAVFQSPSRDYGGTNAIVIIAVLLCGGFLKFLVDHSVPQRGNESMTDFSRYRSGIRSIVFSGPVS
jgi:hypothetical protein